MTANANVTIPEVITTNSITSESSSVSLLAGSPGPVKTAAEKLAAKQKKQNQFNWGRRITGEDFDYEKKDDDSIIIKKVQGQEFDKLKSEMLKGICSSMGIAYTSKNTATMRKEIANVISVRKELGKIANGSTKSNIKKAPAKDSCPLYIKENAYEATFLKLVNVILHEKPRSSYLALFDRYDKEDYDTRTPKKEAVKELTNFYTDPPEDINTLGLENFPEMKEKFGGVEDDDPILASDIKEEDMMRCIHHLNKLYRSDRNKKNKSGQHQPFSDYASKSFVLYYHLRLEKSGCTGLENVAYAELAPDVFNASEGSTAISSDTAKSNKRKNDGIAETLKKKQLKLLEKKLEQNEKILEQNEKNNEKNNDVGESVIERNKAITKFMSASARAGLIDQLSKLRREILAAEKEEGSEENTQFITILKAELNNVKNQLGV